jgi:orotidine-5'-phosphate decarboxylase
MDSDKIIQELNQRFAAPLPEFYKRRIVFWYDEDGEFQDRLVDGTPVYELVADMVNKWGAACPDPAPEACGYTNVGAVVGATYPEMGKRLRELMPGAFILVPGYGAQGGKGKDLVNFFNKDGLGAIVNSSRGIIAAWKQEKYAAYGEEHFEEAARAAVIDMQKDIAEALA